MPEELPGGCLCGAVRYRMTASPAVVTFCHCTACRRGSGAPAVAWATVRPEEFSLTRGALAFVASSPGVRRGFCGRCGTPITYQADFLGGYLDVTTGSLDDPDLLPPQMHIWTTHRLEWMRGVLSHLPEHPEFPAG